MAEGMGYPSQSDELFDQVMLGEDGPKPATNFAETIGGIHPLTTQEVEAQVEFEIIDSIGAYGSPVHEQRRINQRRYYGKPFGNEVEGQSQAQVSKELGVSANTLSRWMRQFRSDKVEAFPGSGRQTTQAALISRLRRENDRLRKERDFLKKTASYFARTKEPDSE